MMNLTFREEEAFFRGKAAGFIPAECSIPGTEEEIYGLFQHFGPMFSKIVGCRTKHGKLFFAAVSVFSEEYLGEVIRHLPELLTEASEITPLQTDFFGSPLDELANYFALGTGILNEEDLAARRSALSLPEVRRGFDLEYTPGEKTDVATLEQRMTLSDLVISGSVPLIDRRKWEHLTGKEADELIRSRKKPDELNTDRIERIVREYDRMTPEEKEQIHNIITSKIRKSI